MHEALPWLLGIEHCDDLPLVFPEEDRRFPRVQILESMPSPVVKAVEGPTQGAPPVAQVHIAQEGADPPVVLNCLVGSHRSHGCFIS